MTIFSGKFPFTRPKIVMTFLVIYQVFHIFPFFFPDSPYLHSVKCRKWPFLHKKKHYFRKNSLTTPFFTLFVPFARIPQHYFSKYWGTDAWAIPPPQILGNRPPSPPYR